MSEQNVLNRLSIILEKTSKLELTEPIKAEDQIFEIGINSISLIKAIVMIEQEFGVIFRDEDLVNEHFERVADLVKYIEKLMNSK